VKSPVIVRNELSLPPFSPGMRIGLFGGTFDPPHRAHLGATLLAMKRLNLDRVWWLVTPGNPLKDTSGLAPLPSRIAAARSLTHHPRIDVSGIEAVIKTRYSYDTLSWLMRRCRGVRFVWIMGADNLRSFHRWQRWREIASLIPFVVVDRLGPSLYAAASPAAHALARWRIPEEAARSLPSRRAPAWTYLHGLKSALSSTALRALRRGTAPRKAVAKKTGSKASGSKASGPKALSSNSKSSGFGKKPGAKAAGIKQPAARKTAGAKRRATAVAKGRKPTGRTTSRQKPSGKKRRQPLS
jgi:nicotinate-nucleotide adenylyltransferase